MKDAHGNEIKIGSVVKPVGHWDYVGRIEVTEFTPTEIRGVRFYDEQDVWFAASAVRVIK